MTAAGNPTPLVIEAAAAPPRTRRSDYPEPFFSRMANLEKRPLGDAFELKSFGVNLTTLQPGGESALLHCHSRQDEFVHVLTGRPTLVTEQGEIELRPGMCASFRHRGSRTSSSTAPARSSSISRSANARPAKREPTLPTTSWPCSDVTAPGSSRTRTAGRTEPWRLAAEACGTECG